jgi:hypothetical protein
MPYVRVKLIASGAIYNAEVDPEIDPKTIAVSLAEDLGLPKGGNYRIALIDTSAIREGATLELITATPAKPGRIIP